VKAILNKIRALIQHPARRALLFWVIPLAFMGLFFYQPLIRLFGLLISPDWGFSLKTVNVKQILDPLGFTFGQALLSTLLTLLIGLPGAWLFARFTFPGRGLLKLLVTLPFILPTVVVAAGFNALLGPRGWLNLGLMALLNLDVPPIQFLNTFGAILVAHIFYNTSIIIRVVSSAWSGLNVRLNQAAQVLGANPWRQFIEITLPLLLPAILAGTLLVFLFNFTSFGVILMLGGPKFATLEVEIYIQALHLLNLPLAAILSLIQLLITLSITIFHNRLSVKWQPAGGTQGRTLRLRKPKRGLQRLAATLLIISIFILLVSPLAALALRSFVKLEANRGERGDVQTGLTLQYYQELSKNRRGSLFYVPPLTAAFNSLRFALITIGITLCLGILAAYALKQNTLLNRWLDPLLMLPLGASAITLGLGFIITFNRPPWTQINFPILLPIAYSLIALPFVVRTLAPALKGIPDSLRNAARNLGAPPWRVWWEIDLPILSRALLVSAVFAMTISLGEFGASSFLSRPDYPTLPVAIYRYISQPGALNYGQALAMSTLLMLICAGGIILIEKIRLPGKKEC
jgi:thiamine transport system permease protein